MLHRCAENYGWNDHDMMNMPKRRFYRYYGYIYQDRLREEDEMERVKRENKLKQDKQNKPRQWK